MSRSKESSSKRGSKEEKSPAYRSENRDSCGENNCSSTERLKGESEQEFEERRKLQSQLSRIKHKIIVLSGKGGVGKSTIAVNAAAELAMAGKRVGLLDVDIHGPSIPTMLGIENARLDVSEDGLIPIEVDGIKVMSIGFLLRNQDDAVIWRGPMKMGIIKQFLRDVAWGELDYLIIDSPPGTGDEPLSVCQLIGDLSGAIIVTTPQKVAAVDVRKSITFCRELRVPVIGVIENMSGFACPRCGEITQIMLSGGGKSIAKDMRVEFLGAIPIDPGIARACDSGKAFMRHYKNSSTALIMRKIISPLLALDSSVEDPRTIEEPDEEGGNMKIAIPLAEGRLSMHFGHCESFALMDVDPVQKKIIKRQDLEAPPHEPGLLPTWLSQQGADVIIAGGMGRRAKALFSEKGIKVVVGAQADTPERLVADYLAGTLSLGENICDH